MKKIKLLLLLSLLTTSLFVSSCKNNNEFNSSSTPQIDVGGVFDDNELPEITKPNDKKQGVSVLPSAGSNTNESLDFSVNVSSYDNSSLHLLNGQWSGYGIHYPSILKHNGVYYLYESTPDLSVGIRALRSLDLVSWEYVTDSTLPLGYVTKARETFGAKAPRVIFYNDLFYLYFSTGSGYKVFTSSSPEGEFNYLGDLNYSSKYYGTIFKAPNGKLFFVTGGETSVVIYEMNSILDIDLNSRYEVPASKVNGYFGESSSCQTPSIIDINGVSYLTYSKVEETLSSYRSYLLTNVSPNYDTSKSLGESFRTDHTGPLLISSNTMDGTIGLGDVSIIEGPNLSSYYAIYTSLENVDTRRLNIAPIHYSNGSLSIEHRDEHSLIQERSKEISFEKDNNIYLSNKIDASYTASISFEDVDKFFISYKTSKNNYHVSFEDNKATLHLMENGLDHELKVIPIQGHFHTIKVDANNDVLSISLDDVSLLTNYKSRRTLEGKLGYTSTSSTKLGYISYNAISKEAYQEYMLPAGESNILPSNCLEEFSKADTLIEQDNNFYSSFYGKDYISLSKNKDYARFLVDVKESGRYALELVNNGSFNQEKSPLGLRLGKNKVYMFTTPSLGEADNVRYLTIEENLEAGANEIYIENLSSMPLRLFSLRLVKVSTCAPSYVNSLEDYVTSGVHYVTDFRIDEGTKAHMVYESSKAFAYIGDNTITDFSMTFELSFPGSSDTTGYIGIGFRCNNFASSRFDNDESLTGYYLQVSQFEVKLMKHNYGFGTTLGSRSSVNPVGEFVEYTIEMQGNQITVYKEDAILFKVVDPYAFTNGHLAMGSKNVNGLIRKLKISGMEGN